MKDVGDFIKGQLAVWFDLVDEDSPTHWSRCRMCFIAGRRRIASVQAAAAGEELQAAMHHAAQKAVLESLMIIAHLPKFIVNPAFPPADSQSRLKLAAE